MSVRGFFCSSCEQYFEFAEDNDLTDFKLKVKDGSGNWLTPKKYE